MYQLSGTMPGLGITGSISVCKHACEAAQTKSLGSVCRPLSLTCMYALQAGSTPATALRHPNLPLTWVWRTIQQPKCRPDKEHAVKAQH